MKFFILVYYNEYSKAIYKKKRNFSCQNSIALNFIKTTSLLITHEQIISRVQF